MRDGSSGKIDPLWCMPVVLPRHDLSHYAKLFPMLHSFIYHSILCEILKGLAKWTSVITLACDIDWGVVCIREPLMGAALSRQRGKYSNWPSAQDIVHKSAF